MTASALRAALAKRLGLSPAELDMAALTMLLRHVDRIDSRVHGRVRDAPERVKAASMVSQPIKLRPWHSGDGRALAALLKRLRG